MTKKYLTILILLIIIFPIRMYAQTAPSAPQSPYAGARNGSSIDVGWHLVTGATSYNVYRSLTSDGIFTVTTSTGQIYYRDMNLPRATTQYYYITAINANGESSPSTHVSATTNSQLDGPDTIGCGTGPSFSLLLYWSHAPEATLYNVYRSSSRNGTYTKIAERISSTSYRDSNLPCGTTRYYCVTGVNETEESSLNPSYGVSGRTSNCTSTPPNDPEVDPVLQKKWAKTKNSYIKSFNSIANNTSDPSGNVVKKVQKYTAKLLNSDKTTLLNKISNIKASSTNEKILLEQDVTVLENTQDLNNKKNILKTKVNTFKNQIKNIYTELNLFVKINTYETTKTLGNDSYSVFNDVCPNNINLSELQTKATSLGTNIGETRNNINLQKYEEAKKELKQCSQDAKRITSLIKTITKVCVVQ